MGLYDLDNRGPFPVTLLSLHLDSPYGLTMTRAWLVPIFHDLKNGNWDLVGVQDYPPATWPEWRYRCPADTPPGSATPETRPS